MRRVLGLLSAITLLLLFPFVLRAAFPSVATNTWSPAQSLTVARSGAATVMLQDGRLLITGGSNGNNSAASVDIVDTAGNITAGPPMNMARSQHTATVLEDGRVLVVGGVDVSGNPIGTAEIFDPSINAAQANPWTSTGPLVQARSGQTATLLHDGTVLIAGGMSGTQVLSTLELFDAASGANGSFTMVAATLSSPRAKHAAALLEDGRVLVVGGWDGTVVPPQPPATIGTPRTLASTDIYDPSAQQVRAGPVLNVARMSLTATTQLDGQVFVAGGDDGTLDLASTETFDPIASPQPATFTLGKFSLTTPRSDHLAILLPHNGGTLLVGGSSNGTAIASAELYMPVYLSQSETATLTPVPNAMSAARVFASGSPLSDGSATSVNDGLLLVAGGTDASGKALSSAEYFGFAWVKTDALEYAPGTPVNITGGGFQPGETVTLHLQEFPYYDSPADMTAVVKADGTFSNSTFAPDTYDLNTGFFLTATGSASHYQAQTVFADNVQVNGATITVENAACTAGQTVFTQGDSVCANVAVTTNGNGASATFYIVWFDPSGAVVTPDSQTVSGNTTITDTLATTGSSATGTWTVKACDAANCSTSNGKKVWDSKTFTVREATSTALNLTSGSSPSTYGDSLTFMATVSSGAGTPSGSVSFYDGGSCAAPGTLLSGPTTLSSGKASFSVSNLSAVASPHTILACYAGTATGFGPSGLSLAQAVNPKALTAQGTLSVPSSRIYDGTTTAAISGSAALLATETIGTGTSADGKPFTGDAVTLSATGPTSATYNSKDVSAANTVTFNGLTLTGAASGNYTLTAPTQAATITQKALTYSGLTVAASKVYDGTTNAVVSGTAVLQSTEAAGAGSTSDGKPYAVDSVSVSGTPTGTYNSKDVLTATTVTFGGESLTGTGSGNYTLTAATQAATITAKVLTYSGLTVATSKVYDATTNAVVSGTAALQSAEPAGNGSTADGKPYSGDGVSLTGTATGTYNSKDVATANTVTFGGVSLTGTDSGDYTLTAATQSATITAKALTYTGLTAPASRIYDGTTNATLSGSAALQSTEAAGAGSASDGKPYSGDGVSLTGTATGTYNSKDVATANTVTFGGVSLTGTDGGDYTLTAATQAATIAAKALTITGLSASNKSYDGGTNATLAGNAALQAAEAPGSGTSADGAPYSGDAISLAGTAAGAFASKNAANGISVSVTGLSLSGAQMGDYSLTALSLTANITPATLTAAIIGTPSKTYDGTTSAALTSSNFALTGLVGSETLTVAQTAGAYNSANVASATTITASLSPGDFTPGTDTLASNYNLPTAASGPGKITAVTLTASIINNPTKPYDGNASATLTSANYSLSGLVGTESFTVTQTSGTYNSANVADATAVTASLSPGNFTDGPNTVASNYNLPTTASGTGHITAVTVMAAIVGNPTKPYDGNASAQLTSANYSLSGLVGAESFTVTQTAGTYNSANVADASTVTASLSAGNFAAGQNTVASNYNLPTTASGTGHITAVTVTAAIVGNPTKPYDGNASATLTSDNFSLTGLVSGQSFTVTQTAGTYNSANVAEASTVTASLSAGNFTAGAGMLASNYSLPTTASGTGHISKVDATVAVSGYDVTYNGNSHTASGSAIGVDKTVLAGLDLSGTTHTNAGTTSDNWTFTDATGNYNNTSGAVTDVIRQAAAAISVTPYNVTYNGSPHTAAGTATGVNSEALSGLDLTGTTHTNAGTTTDAWTFHDPNGNYADATGSVIDVIAKANQTALSLTTTTPLTFNQSETLSANGGTVSGLVTFNLVSGPCSISGNQLTANSGTGSCAVTATMAGNDNYNDVTSTTNSVSLAKANQAALTLTTTTPLTYNQTETLSANGGTVSGLVTYNLAPGPCSISGNQLTANSGTGTCAVTATMAGNDNYNDVTSTTNSVSLTKANQAALAVAVSSPASYGTTQILSITGGSGTGALTFSVGGSTACSVSGSTLSITSGTGTCSVTATQAADSNYNQATSPAASMIVQPATAGITITPYTVVYDGKAHTATGTATGVNSANVSTYLDLSGTTHTSPGKYSADAWSFHDPNGNYADAHGSVVDVITYGFVGLEAPYAPPPVTFNVQRTMPIVWQYTNASGAVVNSASANPQVQIYGPTCGAADTPSDMITVTSAGNSGYQYDSTTNTWQFNWQVKGNVPGCYNIVIVNGQTGQTSGPFAISVVSH